MGRSLLRRDEVTMADVFAENGYRTGIFGKWHLGDNYPFRPQDRGFQEVLVHGGGGVGQTPDYWGNDYFDDTYWHNGKPKKFSGYCTDVWFNEVLKFMEESGDRPFFCYLSTNAPHWPYNVADKYVELYKGKENVPNEKFYGMITNIDDNVGRLLKKLKDLRLEQQTVLIFMTDNGTAEGWSDEKGYNAGMRGIKGSEYDGGHRVPCFIRWPGGGLGRGRDVLALTAHIDLLPTLIELCRLQGHEGIKFDGKSLVGNLFGDEADGAERIVITDSQRIDHPEKWRKSAVMTDRWRLINGKRLYDMKADPGQKKNLDDEHPKVVGKLRKVYEQWWTDTSKRFDEYCEIIIGSDKENPSRLTCHDWHGPDIPWNQDAIRSAARGNGFWAVEVERDGEYEFSLRRWPEELDLPITKTIAGGKTIGAANARLKIGCVDISKPVLEDATSVMFRINLKAGKTLLQTWFTDGKGVSRGAYYVYVRRLT
jgi:arylsulfatase A-like enzyme